MNAPTVEKVEVYGSWNNPTTWRARIALELKGVEFEYIPGETMPQDSELRTTYAGQPLQLGQTLAFLDFLEERYPSPSLLPLGLVHRAQARQLAEIMCCGTQPSVLNRLERFQSIAARTAGKFSVGDRPSWADLCLIPELYSARILEIDLAPFDLLRQVEGECGRLRAFQMAHAVVQVDAPK